jgi:antitoxin ParD1/3/4
MGKLERITVTMSEEMAARIRAAVDSGEYTTTSEIVREALRDWCEEQDRKQVALQRLREMIAEGEKGPFYDGPTVMAELRARVAAKVSEEMAKRGKL